MSGELEGAFRATWSGSSAPIFVAVSLLSPGWIVPMSAIAWRRSCGIILVLCFPSEKGLQSFWRYCFAISSDVLGSLLPTFSSHFPLTKKVSWGCIPFSLTVFILLLPSLLLLCIGVEVKIEVKQKKCKTCSFDFGYLLTMLRGEFSKCRTLHDM